jgi:3-hydroxyacyl-[acyl-carrier-protein] dehydratase
MRFELVDVILERSPHRIVTAKAVTSAEEYLADHFPGFAVLPGVMMLEAMVQAARRLLELEGIGAPARVSLGGGAVVAGAWVLAEVRNVRYGNMVRPGQVLTVTVEKTPSDGDRHVFSGKGVVGEQTAVQGRFTLRPML